MGDEKKLTGRGSKPDLIRRVRQKEWMTKLEAVSGKRFEVESTNGFVYLLIDCSGSMSASNKLQHAKLGAKGFPIDAHAKGYSIGLISFDSHASHLLELQRDLTVFERAVQKLQIGGSTNMAEAIVSAVTHLGERPGTTVICIATDGKPDDKGATLRAADDAKDRGIEIMTIGTDDADNEFLALLATTRELAVKVATARLREGITSMARLLPDRS